MGLRNLNYQPEYRSGEDDLLRDFFHASLTEARRYWRAVGYFSSSAFEAFGLPLNTFVQNRGKIRLITSVELTQDDLTAIDDGLSKRDVCARRISHIIDEQFAAHIGRGVTTLCTLLQVKRLDIRIAVPRRGTGIFHEKVGVFFDEADYVAFSGSANESRNAFENNYECVDVFPAWVNPDRAERKRKHFEALWNNQSSGVEIFDFPDAAAQRIIQLCSSIKERRVEYVTEDPKWRHQREAVERFLQAERGVLNMATGTGKTRTALRILAMLFNDDLIDTAIIAMHGTDLLEQWYGEILQRIDDVQRPLNIFRHYDKHRDRQEFSMAPHNGILLASHQPLAKALADFDVQRGDRTLLIHDEVHRLGSPENRTRLHGLSDALRFRLGLSATPDREYDQEGNDFIEQHIGPTLMTFGLDEAIARGILAPFTYHPLDYEITEEDRQRLQGVYAKEAARKKTGTPMRPEEVWMEIARVYKTSQAKLPIFDEFIQQNQHLLERCIIFVETQEYGQAVLEIVHKYRADFHTYFSGEDSDTLRRFARGELECLLACHRLSEGIDIRSLNSVILFASSRARLETIQRIGRCLRTDPTNPDKVANIVDFIRTTADEGDYNADTERADWLNELSQIRPVE